MDNLNLEMILLALLGLTTHVCATVINRKKSHGKISLKAFFSDGMNWVRIVMSIASLVALLIMADDLVDFLGVKLSDDSIARKMFAFAAGHAPHAFIRYVLKVFKNRINKEEKDGEEIENTEESES